MDNKLILIDGNSLFYREFFALPTSFTNKDGDPTNAIYGFAKMLIDVITKLKPTHMAVAFDVSSHTFRNDVYSGYKATRKPMPIELRNQLLPLKNMLDLMNIKYVQKEGIEGDDVLGSLSRKFDIPKIILTGDRDSYQLVNDSTVVYLNKKGLSDIAIIDESALQQMFGLTPSQMVYVKSLQGDSSDNIPGVKGVGEKTALSLIQKYGDLDGVYAHIDEIGGSLHNKLVTYKDDAYLSLELAKIKLDEELDCDLEDTVVHFPFNDDVRQFFVYNGFKSLLNKAGVFSEEGKEDVAAHVVLEKKECNTIKSFGEIKRLLEAQNELGFYFSEDLSSIGISNGTNDFLVNFKDDNSFDDNEVWELIKEFIEDNSKRKVFFNSKRDRKLLLKQGIVKISNYFDCMIASHLVSGKSITEIAHLLEDEEVIEFNQVARMLVNKSVTLTENLQRLNMMSLYVDVELPLCEVLFDMEMAGFKIDEERLRALDDKYDREIEELTNLIYKTVGREFNINSPKQLAEIIYDELALSKSRKRSTASDVLASIADRHALIPLIIRYRKVSKFSNGFIKNMYQHIDKEGFIHTNFNQTLTTTGRLSSSEPNLQNIPIRGDESREIRSIFVARKKDNVLIDVDYSQIELRIMAHLTEDEELIEAFKKGLDVHTQTAAFIFGVDPNLVTPEMRRMAKVVNFGINYGMSEFGLAGDLGISVFEARQYIQNFFSAHPKIKAFMEDAVDQARQTGRVSTILGRTRMMEDIKSSNYQVRSRAERASYNMPVQGSASDIIKIAMINLHKDLINGKFEAKLIMQVHDELIVDAPKSEEEEVKKLIERNMKEAYQMAVPLEVDCSSAYRWSEGH